LTKKSAAANAKAVPNAYRIQLISPIYSRQLLNG
jgi:hypothetical protein